MDGSDLVTFMPAEDFTGYPFGDPVEFRAGVESAPVPADYLTLLKSKGHVADSAMPAPVEEMTDGR